MNLDITLEENSKIAEIQQAQTSLIALKYGLESFKRYIPADLVKLLISQGKEAKVGGEEKQLAILFTDIEGFTTISETTTPQQMMEHLSEYFNELVGIIVKNHGTIDKYIGDAILAFWGAPLDVKEPCLLAVKSALEMNNALIELNKKWINEGKKTIKN
ncbi:MAG: adenylate/guanylate cyclase domain-containing protein [Campylobacterales bacterium]|nr:adenylate/guanylate cyclase domain-containing protein [Campylobacterales bacterium]